MTCSAVEAVTTYDMLPLVIADEKLKVKAPLTSLNRDQLIEAIAWIMEDIIKGKCNAFTNESEIPNKTVFHAKILPSISLQDYLTRFSRYAKCEDDVLIYALIYLDRIGESLSQFALDSFNVHKLLLMSMSVACKFCDDSYFTNKYYANVGGISTEEFNTLEEEYLVNYLQFTLYVKPDTYYMYYSDVIKYYQEKISQKKHFYQ